MFSSTSWYKRRKYRIIINIVVRQSAIFFSGCVFNNIVVQARIFNSPSFLPAAYSLESKSLKMNNLQFLEILGICA